MKHKPELVLAAVGLFFCGVVLVYDAFQVPSGTIHSVPQNYSTTVSVSTDKSRYAVDINHATKEELLGIRFLNETLVDSILAYRNENGRFLTEEDLLNISGIGDVTLEKIRPYITLG